jgi:hypothetical protein
MANSSASSFSLRPFDSGPSTFREEMNDSNGYVCDIIFFNYSEFCEATLQTAGKVRKEKSLKERRRDRKVIQP